MIIYIIFLSMLIGTYGLNKPLISLILGFFLIFLLLKEKSIKNIILSICIILIFYIKMIIFSRNVFLNYGIVTSSKDNYFILFNGFSKFYVPLENNSYQMLDFIKIEGELVDYSFDFYEGNFDFNQYLNSKFIYKQINMISTESIFSFPLSSSRIYNLLINKLSEDGKAVISELLFSRNYSNQYSSFISNSNLFYLLNLSSLHIYYLFYILRGLLETKLKEKDVDRIILIFCCFLTFINSFKISLLRFLIYQVVDTGFKHKKIEVNYLKKVILTLIILGIIDQSYYCSSSFLYHLLIPLHFIISKDAISTFKFKHQSKIRVFSLYLVIFFISLVIDESFSFLSILLTPLFTFIILILIFLSLLTYVLPLSILLNVISRGLLNVFSLISEIDLTIYISNKRILFFILYVFFYFLILWTIENRVKIFRKIAVLLFISNIVISKIPIDYKNDSGVYFINVGQGDSILIHSRNTNVLVDTGGIKNKDVSKEILIPFFRKKNIYHLDYVFLTHNDFDHTGGFESLKTYFKVRDYNVNNEFTHITINDLDFKNLNPSNSNEDNNDSLVLYFTLNNTNYLLLGDADKSIEEKIIKTHPFLDVDVLKIGHHGSSTSTSESLLSTYNIDTAIISCSKNNYYGHPKKEVIDLLTKYQISIRRTDEEGTIYIKS